MHREMSKSGLAVLRETPEMDVAQSLGKSKAKKAQLARTWENSKGLETKY